MTNAQIKFNDGYGLVETTDAIAKPCLRMELNSDGGVGEMVGFTFDPPPNEDGDSVELVVNAATFKDLVLLIRRSDKFPDLENALNAY